MNSRQRDIFSVMGHKDGTTLIRNDWAVALEAIVAINEDPEHQHRIKVIIPSIDEDEIHDDWINRMVWFTGAEGYGDFHIPGIGSEVLLFGRTAEKHHLYYISRFNEDFRVPPDFDRPTVRGFRHDGDYKQIVELDFQIRAGRLEIEADASITLIAPGGIFLNGRRIA